MEFETIGATKQFFSPCSAIDSLLDDAVISFAKQLAFMFIARVAVIKVGGTQRTMEAFSMIALWMKFHLVTDMVKYHFCSARLSYPTVHIYNLVAAADPFSACRTTS
jgi:hypothetical protein